MTVTIEVTNAAAVVTLRWPEQRNALGPSEASSVASAIDEASQLDVSAVIVTGEGAFCSGGHLRSFADLSARMTPSEIRTHVYGDVQAIIRNLRDAQMTTIAAIDGPAVGLGMDLALACDQRFIGPQGWIQQGWGRAGLISATGGTWFLQRLAPGLVWQLLAEQPVLDQAHASELRLCEVGNPTALEAAIERADALSSLPREVMRAYVDISRAGMWPDDDYLDRSATYQAKFIGSERFRELAASILGRWSDRK